MAERSILGTDKYGHVSQTFRPGATQNVAYTGTAGTITNAVSYNHVMVWSTTDCFITFGSAPTATTSHMPLSARTHLVFKVEAGVDKVSAIQQSAGGTLYVTEMT